MKIKVLEITIDNTVYRATDFHEVVKLSEERCLILNLFRPYPADEDLQQAEASGELVLARAKALRSAYAHKFPVALPLKDTVKIHSTHSVWTYVAVATPGSIEWAKSAMDCGLIDSYIVDCDPLGGQP